jgi:hypothetical protein
MKRGTPKIKKNSMEGECFKKKIEHKAKHAIIV